MVQFETDVSLVIVLELGYGYNGKDLKLGDKIILDVLFE